MRPGDYFVDLRDKSVVRILRIYLPAKERETPLVKVVDIMKSFVYVVDAKHLSPRAVHPDAVLEWIKSG